MGKILVIEGTDFSDVAVDKVKIIDSATVDLVFNKAFLLKEHGSSPEPISAATGRALFVIKKTDTNIPLNFNTDYSFIPILGNITKISVKMTNGNYNFGVSLRTSKNLVYDTMWLPAGEKSINITDYSSSAQGQLYLCIAFKTKTNESFTNETLDSLGFKITIG